jgi:hypothetical protein
MASDIQSVLVEAATADPDGISTAAAVGNNANLVIGGALAGGGSVTFDEPRNVTILSAGDDSGISFTVTGTDEQNAAQTETISGVDSDTATGSKFFATVTQIAAVGNPAGDVSAGSGTSVAAPMYQGRMRLRGIYAVNTGSAGTITFREGSGTGGIRMQFNTVASANTTQYPDIPDDGILFKDGGFVTYTQTALSSLTVFYEG